MLLIRKHTDINATGLKMALDKLFDDLSRETAGTPEYNAISDQIVKLYALRETDSKVASTWRMSPDAKAAIVANLAGILMIVGHERTAVLTSKALALITKLR